METRTSPSDSESLVVRTTAGQFVLNQCPLSNRDILLQAFHSSERKQMFLKLMLRPEKRLNLGRTQRMRATDTSSRLYIVEIW
jgi:hypothetical protein